MPVRQLINSGINASSPIQVCTFTNSGLFFIIASKRKNHGHRRGF
jgi:hypothetical protein